MRGQVGGEGQPRERGVGACLGDLAFRDGTAHPLAELGACPAERAGVDVIGGRPVAGERAHHGDLRTHGASPGDEDAGDG